MNDVSTLPYIHSSRQKRKLEFAGAQVGFSAPLRRFRLLGTICRCPDASLLGLVSSFDQSEANSHKLTRMCLTLNTQKLGEDSSAVAISLYQCRIAVSLLICILNISSLISANTFDMLLPSKMSPHVYVPLPNKRPAPIFSHDDAPVRKLPLSGAMQHPRLHNDNYPVR